MKIEALFLIGVGIFFGIVGAVYWFTSYEDGGTMMLAGTCLLGLLPGSYYMFWHRRMGNRLRTARTPPSRRGRASSARSPARASGPSCSAWAPS